MTDTSKSSRAMRMALRVGFIVAFLGTAGAAFAQVAPQSLDSYLAATQANDWSMGMWRAIFGPSFVDSPFSTVGAPATFLGRLFVVFNAAIFSVGVAWMLYGGMSSIIGTANDGEALGKSINTAWYPIRTVTGIGGLIPVFQGFTLSQALLMWIGVFAIGLANTLMNVATGGMATWLNPGVVSPQVVLDMRKNVRDMYLANVCYKSREVMSQSQSYSSADTVAPIGIYSDQTRIAMHFGTRGDPTMCGSFYVDVSNATDGGKGLGFKVASVNYEGIRNAVVAGHKVALANMQTSIAAIVNGHSILIQIAKNGGDPWQLNPRELDAVAAKYRADLESTVNAALSSADTGVIAKDSIDYMSSRGWLTLGAWFSTFSEANTAKSSAMSAAKISTSMPAVKVYNSYVTEQIQNAIAAIEEADKKEQGKSDASSPDGIISSAFKGITGQRCNSPTGNCSVGQSFVEAAIGGVATSSTDIVPGVRLVNPVIMFKNIGDYTMTVGSALVAADAYINTIPLAKKGAAAAGAALPGPAGMVATLASNVMGLLIPMGMTFVAVGALMSLYMPMIPFIIWMGSVLSYAASFIEGLVAMPLHSLSHLDSQGEGMGQRTGHGYLFMLNTLARPPLMVISFFIASMLMVVVGSFQTALFIPAMANVQGDSVTGLASIIGLLLIFFSINVTLINASFDLIHVIPDQVIGFLGSGSTNTTLGKDAEGKISGAFVMASRRAESLTGGVTQARADKKKAFDNDQKQMSKKIFSD